MLCLCQENRWLLCKNRDLIAKGEFVPMATSAGIRRTVLNRRKRFFPVPWQSMRQINVYLVRNDLGR